MPFSEGLASLDLLDTSLIDGITSDLPRDHAERQASRRASSLRVLVPRANPENLGGPHVFQGCSSTGSVSPSNSLSPRPSLRGFDPHGSAELNLFSWQAVASRNVGLDFTLGERCAEIAEGTFAQSHASK